MNEEVGEEKGIELDIHASSKNKDNYFLDNYSNYYFFDQTAILNEENLQQEKLEYLHSLQQTILFNKQVIQYPTISVENYVFNETFNLLMKSPDNTASISNPIVNPVLLVIILFCIIFLSFVGYRFLVLIRQFKGNYDSNNIL